MQFNIDPLLPRLTLPAVGQSLLVNGQYRMLMPASVYGTQFDDILGRNSANSITFANQQNSLYLQRSQPQPVHYLNQNFDDSVDLSYPFNGDQDIKNLIHQDLSLNFLGHSQMNPQQPYMGQSLNIPYQNKSKSKLRRKLPVPQRKPTFNQVGQPQSSQLPPINTISEKPKIKQKKVRPAQTQVFVHHHHYYYPCPPQSFYPPQAQPQQPEPEVFNIEKVERVGNLSVEERITKVRRYIEKKHRRKWIKKVSYDCRKRVANVRLRIKGRFIKKQEQLDIISKVMQD